MSHVPVTLEDAANEIERLRKILEVFAAPENWLRDGICDPNSSNFKGQLIAHDELLRDLNA